MERSDSELPVGVFDLGASGALLAHKRGRLLRFIPPGRMITRGRIQNKPQGNKDVYLAISHGLHHTRAVSTTVRLYSSERA